MERPRQIQPHTIARALRWLGAVAGFGSLWVMIISPGVLLSTITQAAIGFWPTLLIACAVNIWMLFVMSALTKPRKRSPR